MSRHTQSRRIFPIVLILTLGSSVIAMAQSGRRTPKTAPAPVPMPQATPIQTKAAEKKPQPALTLVVGLERSNYYGPYGTSSGNLLLNFVDRLDDNPSVKVDAVRSDMNNAEAVRRAKAEKEAYVVLLRLRAETPMSGSTDNAKFYLQYWVFAPTTAKLKTSGQTYPQTYRNKGVIIDRRAPNIYGDYKLQQAAREAAERILSAFNLQAPGRRS